MTYSWLAVEARTGNVIAELPDFTCDRVSKQIGDGTTASGSLPLTHKTASNWRRAILEGGSALVLVDDETGAVPWGGMVTHTAPDETDTVPVNLASYETGYLSRRFVRDVEYSNTGAVDIIVDLLTRFVLTGSNGGIPMRIVVEGSSRGIVLEYQEYLESSEKTVLSALQTLSALDGGPEWTIGWETLDGGRSYTPLFRVSGTKLGVRTQAGMSPAATFEIPGPVAGLSLDRDYTDGSGANDVVATSTASGATSPQSPHVVTADPNRPTFELRFTPDTDLDDDAALLSHAQSRAAEVAGGSQTLALTAAVKDAPRLGVDWSEGDDIGYVVGRMRSFPDGLSGVVRALGWELSLEGDERVTPVLEGPGGA